MLPSVLNKTLKSFGAACVFTLCMGQTVYACDKGCEETIDDLSASARNSNQSVAQGRNNSVVVQYGAGVPVLKCRPLNFCSLQLQPGEVPIEDLALGDSVLWSAQVRVSGSAERPNVRILIKPDDKATQTSLLVATNKRFYDIQLIKSDIDYTNVLAFTYPQEVAALNRTRIANLNAKAAKSAAAKKKRVAADHARKSVPVGNKTVHVAKLDFDYKVSGKTKFKPIRVFNDGKKTYIDLPENYSGEKPVFLASGTQAASEIVNSRWSGNRLTVDRVIEAGSLVRGVGGRAEKISIKRK